MATAPPSDTPADAPAPKKSRKKLFIIAGLVLVLLLGLGGGGTLFYMKKKAAAAAETEGEAEEGPAKAVKRDRKLKPAFVQLDMFTVNLADRDADRYAQIQMTFELNDEKAAEMVKNFMPIIRNSVLMTLSHKTSAELLEKDGKLKLSRELRREAAKALGMEPPPDDDQPAAQAKGKAPAPAPEDISPVIGVHFSNFIIQ
ncbi:MAG: flagellar basal body-associated protein FliL [Rubrivivax sp.]